MIEPNGACHTPRKERVTHNVILACYWSWSASSAKKRPAVKMLPTAILWMPLSVTARTASHLDLYHEVSTLHDKETWTSDTPKRIQMFGLLLKLLYYMSF